MFETKQEIRKAVQALVDETENLSRGDTLAWEQIEQITGLTRDDWRCRYIVRLFRTRLLKDRGIALWPAPGIGFEFLSNPDQVRVPGEARQRRMRRQARKALAEVSAADASSLNLVDRRLRLATIDMLRKEEQGIREGLQEMSRIKKGERNPIPKHLVEETQEAAVHA